MRYLVLTTRLATRREVRLEELALWRLLSQTARSPSSSATWLLGRIHLVLFRGLLLGAGVTGVAVQFLFARCWLDKVLQRPGHDIRAFGRHVLQDLLRRRFLLPMCAYFVRAEVLVVDVLDLECLRRRVLVLANEFLRESAPHQWLCFGIRNEIISALANDAIVQSVEIDVSDADFGLGFEICAMLQTCQRKCILEWAKHPEEPLYPRFSWYSLNFCRNSPRSSVRSMDSPRRGAMVETERDGREGNGSTGVKATGRPNKRGQCREDFRCRPLDRVSAMRAISKALDNHHQVECLVSLDARLEKARAKRVQPPRAPSLFGRDLVASIDNVSTQ